MSGAYPSPAAGAWERIISMQFENILVQKKDAIIKSWIDMVVSSYAPDTAQFIRSRKDRFANPIGSSITTGLTGLFEQLLDSPEEAKVRKFLDPIIRIRAIQNFTPSQSTAFVLVIKKIVRDNLKKELADQRTASAIAAFEANVDAICLLAFDIYMECREKIYELKTNTERDKIYKAFERAGIVKNEPDSKPVLKEV